LTPVLPAPPFFYAIIDAAMAGERSLTSWVSLLAGAGRAPLVQWRFKGLTDALALRGARELREATRAAGVLLIINDRPDIARIVDADGVHLGQDDLQPHDARALLGGAIVGVSTHNRAQFEAALETPADYLAIGPVFGTTTKANPDPAVGLDFVSWASARTTKPLVAIGGITTSNADAVVRAGAHGLAVISSVMKAEHPDHAVADLVAAMGSWPPR
jgi:thiamine-phosphate pyrophosphorylase